MIAVAHTRHLDLFYFDEHHGWNLKASQEIESHPDKICLKFISQKKTCGVNCYIAYSHETKIHLFKVCLLDCFSWTTTKLFLGGFLMDLPAPPYLYTVQGSLRLPENFSKLLTLRFLRNIRKLDC